MALFGASSSASANTTAQGDLARDQPLNNPPEDSISEISFSPAQDHLAVASWDKKVRLYEVNSDGTNKGLTMWEHEGPALSVAFSQVCN